MVTVSELQQNKIQASAWERCWTHVLTAFHDPLTCCPLTCEGWTGAFGTFNIQGLTELKQLVHRALDKHRCLLTAWYCWLKQGILKTNKWHKPADITHPSLVHNRQSNELPMNCVWSEVCVTMCPNTTTLLPGLDQSQVLTVELCTVQYSLIIHFPCSWISISPHVHEE